jgi:hypothetical protein
MVSRMTVSVSRQQKCCSRIIVIVRESILYTIPDDGIQTTITKLIYRTLLACLRNIWSFRLKMTIKQNKVNAELGVAERPIA